MSQPAEKGTFKKVEKEKKMKVKSVTVLTTLLEERVLTSALLSCLP